MVLAHVAVTGCAGNGDRFVCLDTPAPEGKWVHIILLAWTIPSPLSLQHMWRKE